MSRSVLEENFDRRASYLAFIEELIFQHYLSDDIVKTSDECQQLALEVVSRHDMDRPSRAATQQIISEIYSLT